MLNTFSLARTENDYQLTDIANALLEKRQSDIIQKKSCALESSTLFNDTVSLGSTLDFSKGFHIP